MKKKGFKISLFMMLLSLSLIPLILSVAIISATSLYITKNNLEESAEDTLYIVANNLANYCRENEINAINASEYYDYLDSLKGQGIEMAIIIDGAPCATSIKNENDYRVREIEVEQDTKTGFYDEYVLINEQAYYGYYMPIESNGSIIGMAFAGELQETVTGAINSTSTIFGVSAVVLIIVFTGVVIIASKILTGSFVAVGKSVNALAKGDLRPQNEHRSSVKEMATLLGETKVMQGNLADTIGQVKSVSAELVENIANVTQLSQSSNERANQITVSMGELSTATMSMAENVQDINMQMMEMGNYINDISANVDRLSGSSENILNSNNTARENMETIMESNKASVEAVRDISEQISKTNESINEIDQAVELILNISEQTNLLSLNASIEAARAGVHGRGFAVVAEEIRGLSEQSAEGAEMIKNLAGVIIEKSQKSVRLADRVYTLMKEEQENVLKTQQKYEELSRDIDSSVTQIRSIAEKTTNLADAKEKVIENVQALSAISEENAAGNQEVNANISEIIAEVQMVNVNCEKMNGMASDLKETVSFFKE